MIPMLNINIQNPNKFFCIQRSRILDIFTNAWHISVRKVRALRAVSFMVLA